MRGFSSLPSEILIDIFVKSGNVVLNQVFASNNIEVDINDAYHIYADMETLRIDFKGLYEFLNNKEYLSSYKVCNMIYNIIYHITNLIL